MDLTYLTNIFLEEFNLPDPYSINMGRCYYWAYIAKNIHGGELLSTYRHAILHRNKYFYDAERPYGVKSITDIPSFKYTHMSLRHMMKQSDREFRRYWKENGKYSWDDYEIAALLARIVGD